MSRHRINVLVFHIVFLAMCVGPGLWGFSSSLAVSQELKDPSPSPIEFSARLILRSAGKTSRAQLFVKKDRYRIEHQGGIPTELGYASVAIIRLDKQKVWYVLSQRRLVVSAPLTGEYWLPFSVALEGETERTLIGDAFAGGRPAQLYEVVVKDRDGRREAYYEWVDAEREVLLKLLSQDRDWFVEYEHVVLSQQPDYYFDTPLGYQMIEAKEARSGAE